MAGKRVLSVGQCGADHGGITRTLRQAFGAEVIAAHGAAEALRQLQSGGYALVLVNRLMDADGSAGVDLVRAMKEDEALRQVPVMLVSNYEDAQQEAVSAGAEPGFGKAELGRPQMLDRVRPFLG